MIFSFAFNSNLTNSKQYALRVCTAQQVYLQIWRLQTICFQNQDKLLSNGTASCNFDFK